ncbi:Uncharacterized protein BM_BM17494 [Brugia malayi]|uniref:Uncharacterized protein n=1 Tax=Brugia malayi TaxID=6279 RepID=A0A4E9FKF0_BRUMA|nr:Uncharacterized protein BM_BM17494 [Brugia malayi]VIO93623.1 Uncharacterized protein BM_BM17494 [Brugia malayi]
MCGHVNERRVGKEEDTYHSRPLILLGSSHLANLLVPVSALHPPAQ